MNVLIVRLGALGDIVHTIPAAAALRAAMPDARIDWLADVKHRAIIDLVTVIDRVVTVDVPTIAGWTDAVRRVRQVAYDIALDFQGLMKSAVLARASGAARVAGFSIWHLREKGARPFYSETDRDGGEQSGAENDAEPHVIQKNLRLLRVLGIETSQVEFPLGAVQSTALDDVRRTSGDQPFALINPGAAWPNKQWPPERFGEVAAFLRDIRGLSSVVLWGPHEESLARAVVDASGGAARIAPPTQISDLVALCRAADLMVSGDTGPVHIAAAVDTPVVALYGPTDPHRNGPWSSDDVMVSRFEGCECHYERKCRRGPADAAKDASSDGWCLETIGVAEVTAAIQQRLASRRAASPVQDSHRAGPDV